MFGGKGRVWSAFYFGDLYGYTLGSQAVADFARREYGVFGATHDVYVVAKLVQFSQLCRHINQMQAHCCTEQRIQGP